MLNDSKGNASMMRAGFLISLILGFLLCLTGMYAVLFTLDGAETLIVSGASLVSTSGFAKAVQKKWE